MVCFSAAAQVAAIFLVALADHAHSLKLRRVTGLRTGVASKTHGPRRCNGGGRYRHRRFVAKGLRSLRPSYKVSIAEGEAARGDPRPWLNMPPLTLPPVMVSAKRSCPAFDIAPPGS